MWEEGAADAEPAWQDLAPASHQLQYDAAVAVWLAPAAVQGQLAISQAAPVEALQAHWANTLRCAAQQQADASAQCQAAAPAHAAAAAPQPAHSARRRQQSASALRRLLAANASVPLCQLSQLDLSLEQLPGLLWGLAELCPQLQCLAVNMNGLGSLAGLRSCAQLRQLSAQVGWSGARAAGACCGS
jgi:hypothetical protein